MGNNSSSRDFGGRASFQRIGILASCIVVTLYLSGCTAPFTSFTDESTTAHVVRMNGDRLAGGISSIQLNAQRFEKEGKVSYSLFIIYSGPTFLNIGPGKSLVLIIDGQRNEIFGGGSIQHRNVLSIGLVEETAYYHDLDPELFYRIARAKKVDVEIHGSSGVVTRYFKKKNFTKFKVFCDLYMDKAIPMPNP
jgi:hypothetical protein